DSEREHVFSAKFACPVCAYSLQELEPRIFSFNNPMGACPQCDGLGVIQFFDPKRVVAQAHLSLAAGAIRGWDKRNPFCFQMLSALAAHYDFSLETPFNALPEAIQNTLLYGSGRDKLVFAYSNERGAITRREHSFEGIVVNLERRYKESDSSSVREELAKLISNKTCPSCAGARLRSDARNVRIGSQEDALTLHQISHLPLAEARDYCLNLSLQGNKAQIAEKILQEIVSRLQFLINVGLNYLSLDRSAESLSGGEAQRIRLASQIGSGLTGVMYVLDEPSIGLHQRDNERLLETLKHLRDIGNTVIVVEHDEDAIRQADYVVDIGPGAGVHGGHIVAQGTPCAVQNNLASVTGDYLAGRRRIARPDRLAAASATKGAKDAKGKASTSTKQLRPVDPERQLQLVGACGNNLKNVSLILPVGLFTCVTGVSGSGKSTLINDTLHAAVARHLYGSSAEPASYQSLLGLDHFDKVINVDQSPIGRTPRSNPATYTGLLTPIRELFAGVPEARARGYGPGRFSFNVKGGRCEACQGDGVLKVEMHFLPDLYVPCDVCHGKRYNRETLEVQYKHQNIHDILQMTVEQARVFFDAVPVVARKLQTLLDVGLSYITLGQAATTLSGGEAQRIKLALELSKRDTGRTLYILDEPTTGLHFQDIQMLLQVLHRLADHGNTVVVIEHNLDVISTADWVIDLGPEGGGGGGQIIATGTPQTIAQSALSHTGRFLNALFTSVAAREAETLSN
ncbi:MAG: excinuclease ABC subunit UvrA, partial [Pseudomonadota bacterium]